MKTLLISLTALATVGAAPPPKPVLAPSEIVAAAPAADWVAIAPADLLVMTLINDRRVIIQLMPAPFSQGWISNIRKLAAASWWDGTSINRVQDNYVVQWGDASEKKPLPTGLASVPEDDYLVRLPTRLDINGQAFEFSANPPIRLAPGDDNYAPAAGFLHGFPFGMLPYEAGVRSMWPIHCYAMVGVGRNLSPDTGTGAELYAVIGHAPRHLDRNIAVVGRVISGIEHLSSLPRGTGALGFYEKAEERVPIKSIRLASALPAAEQPRFEYLSTASGSFAKYADARANRRDAFFIKPAGGADICNIPVPVRKKA